MPIARKVWQQIRSSRPPARARALPCGERHVGPLGGPLGCRLRGGASPDHGPSCGAACSRGEMDGRFLATATKGAFASESTAGVRGSSRNLFTGGFSERTIGESAERPHAHGTAERTGRPKDALSGCPSPCVWYSSRANVDGDTHITSLPLKGVHNSVDRHAGAPDILTRRVGTPCWCGCLSLSRSWL